mmetsp:Transcript_79908/g.224298  ORF Transcript_79908/g.224298 Transcript_79908/m.224298 type:complete len:246 (+) Transcript_79908:554-1291(+)
MRATTTVASLSSFWSCWILWLIRFCSSSLSSRSVLFDLSSASRAERALSSFTNSALNSSSRFPNSACDARFCSRVSLSFCTSAAMSSWPCPVTWSLPSCALISLRNTSNSTLACSVFSRCFSNFCWCCFASAFNLSTCFSKYLMRSSRPDSRALMSFSSCFVTFSNRFFSSGIAEISDSTCAKFALICCRDSSATWCSLAPMRSSMHFSSCSLHFNSRSSCMYCAEAACIFCSSVVVCSYSLCCM